ncbi:MAG: hypothetical protein Q8910_01630 [Bacteroidota bacterium]|nr:hypothetical protein [Bacteroidota bacterium]
MAVICDWQIQSDGTLKDMVSGASATVTRTGPKTVDLGTSLATVSDNKLAVRLRTDGIKAYEAIIEESRTNYILTSYFNADTNADGLSDNWTSNGTALSTVYSRTIDAIYGSYGQRMLVTGQVGDSNATSGLRSSRPANGTAISGDSWTASVYITKYSKTGSPTTQLQLIFRDSSGTSVGTATTNITGTGWFSITGTAPVNTSTVDMYAVLVGAVNNGVIVDITVGVAQLEKGVCRTSYIPTTTVAVTRNADVVSIPTTGWRADLGTFLVTAADPVDTNNRKLMGCVTDNSNRIALMTNAGSLIFYSNGGGLNDIVSKARSAGYHTFVSAYQNGVKPRVSIDGVSPSSGATNYGTPTLPATAYFGSYDGTSYFYNAAISRLVYCDTFFTDELIYDLGSALQVNTNAYYNKFMKMTHVYRTTSGGTVWSANQNATTATQLFDNAAVVGDALYFGMNYTAIYFGDLKFNIATPLAATSITTVWEYSVSGTTWKTLTVTDGTNNFQNTGTNTIAFTIPSDCGLITNTGGQMCWVRCRITAISGITNGGKLATGEIVRCKSLGITLSAPGGTITDFFDVAYGFDQVNGWNFIKKVGTYYFYIPGHLFIGDPEDATTTSAIATRRSIETEGVISIGMSSSTPRITFGTLVDAVKLTSKDGCYIKYNSSLTKGFGLGIGGQQFNFYSCIIDSSLGGPYSIASYANTTFNGCSAFHGGDSNGIKISRINYQGAQPDYGTITLASGAVIQDIQTTLSLFAIRAEWNTFVRKLYSPDATYVGNAQNDATKSFDCVLIDSTLPSWNIYYSNLPNAVRGQKVQQCYTMNLTVIDENGNPIPNAQVSVKDVNGNGAFFQLVGYNSTAPTPAESGTSFNVNAAVYAACAVGDYIKLGGEIMQVTNKSGGSTFTVTRAQLGSEAHTCPAQRQLLKMLATATTDSNGQTGEGIIEVANYGWSSGKTPGVTRTIILNPITITISAPGYKTFKKMMTISAPVTETISLATVKSFSQSKLIKMYE